MSVYNYDVKEYILYLKKYLKNDLKRIEHCIRVADTAYKLCQNFNCLDIGYKVVVASILHDITKGFTYEEHINLITDYYDSGFEKNYHANVLHGFSASVLAKDVLGIKDEDIISAIECHVCGKPNMSIVDKIVFIADYIEPSREYDSCRRIRSNVFKQSLDMTVNDIINDCVDFYESKKYLVPLVVYEAQKYYNKLVESVVDFYE